MVKKIKKFYQYLDVKKFIILVFLVYIVFYQLGKIVANAMNAIAK